jgi:hypothetical protein
MTSWRPILFSVGIGIGVGFVTHPIMAPLMALLIAPAFIALERQRRPGDRRIR